MVPFESREVGWLRRNRLFIGAAAASFAASPALLALAARIRSDMPSGLLTMLGIFGLLGGAVSAALALANTRPVADRGAIRADGEGIHWNGALRVRRAALKAGFFVPGWTRSPRVLLERRWPRRAINLEVRNESAGRGLLQALGLDATQVVASFSFASLARANSRAAVIGWLLLLGVLLGLPVLLGVAVGIQSIWPALIAALGVLTVIVWMLVLAMPTRAVVGADGVLVSWFWRRRFVRYANVSSIRPFGAGSVIGVVVLLRDGSAVKLPIKPALTEDLNQQRVALVVQRLQQGLAGYRAAHDDRPAPLPERGGRPVGEWIRQLRAIGSGASADHRTAPITAERLWQIVEDPGADPVARAGAAVALGGAIDARGRARLRIMAEATASPEVRRLLDLAANEASEDALGAAISRVQRAS